MLVFVGIFAIFLQNMAYCFPIGPGIGKKSPAGIATKISGRENGINLSISYIFYCCICTFSHQNIRYRVMRDLGEERVSGTPS